MTLADLAVGADPPGFGGGVDRRGWSWAVGRFRWEDTGGGSGKWRFNRVLECADPAGNPPMPGWGSDDHSFWCLGHPWPDQPWRLRLEWVRTEGFGPDEMVEFRDLVPDGVEAEVAACGAGEVVLQQLELTANDGYLLEARATTPSGKPAHLGILRVTASDGRELSFHKRNTADDRTWFEIEDPRASSSDRLSLVVAIQVPLETEFVVMPRVAP